MRSSQRARRPLATLFTWAAAIFLITALGATAAFAWSGGTLFRASHGKKARGTAVSSGYRVSRLRFSRHHEYRPAPTLTLTPSPEPAPTPPPDTTPPNTSISSGPVSRTTSTAASFAFSSTESSSSFECKLDGDSYGPCSDPKSYTGLGVSPHRFSVRAKDAAGNVDATPAEYGWMVTSPPPPPPPADTTPPETSITTGPAATTTATQASFSLASSESDSSLECKLDGAGWSGCTSPKAYSDLAVGAHQFSARAIDGSGNADPTPATLSWTIESLPPPPDTTPPDTSITSHPASSTTSTAASFGFSATEGGSSFECQLDGSTWAGCTSSKSYSDLAVGPHQFSVRATDGSGNVDASPASFSWTVEAETPPPRHRHRPNAPPPPAASPRPKRRSPPRRPAP